MLSQTSVPDDVHAGLEHLFKPEEIVELTLAIVVINSWNRLAVGFRLDVGNYVSHKKPRNPGI